MYYVGRTWRHLANMTERSTFGGQKMSTAKGWIDRHRVETYWCHACVSNASCGENVCSWQSCVHCSCRRSLKLTRLVDPSSNLLASSSQRAVFVQVRRSASQLSSREAFVLRANTITSLSGSASRDAEHSDHRKRVNQCQFMVCVLWRHTQTVDGAQQRLSDASRL